MHVTALKVERNSFHPTEDSASAARVAHSFIIRMLSETARSTQDSRNLQHSYVTQRADEFGIVLFFNSADPAEAMRQTRVISEVMSAKFPESAGRWRIHYHSHRIHPSAL